MIAPVCIVLVGSVCMESALGIQAFMGRWWSTAVVDVAVAVAAVVVVLLCLLLCVIFFLEFKKKKLKTPRISYSYVHLSYTPGTAI